MVCSWAEGAFSVICHKASDNAYTNERQTALWFCLDHWQTCRATTNCAQGNKEREHSVRTFGTANYLTLPIHSPPQRLQATACHCCSALPAERADVLPSWGPQPVHVPPDKGQEARGEDNRQSSCKIAMEPSSCPAAVTGNALQSLRQGLT